MRKKVTIQTLREKMEKGQKITMITGSDYPLALLEEQAGIDVILVGDSLGMTVLGYDSTLPVEMDLMLEHAKAVRRGAPTAYVIGDMPYMSYQISKEEAVRNAGLYMKAGMDAVMVEGGRNVADVIVALTKATIPVMGHIGLTPQSIAMLGGFKAQARDIATAEILIEDAKAIEEAGVVSILLDAVPPEVAKVITQKAKVPIISIGAGPDCHGQLLIAHDMLGFFDKCPPSFTKKYADLSQIIAQAMSEYVQDVEKGIFPGEEHFYVMPKESLGSFQEKYGK